MFEWWESALLYGTFLGLCGFCICLGMIWNSYNNWRLQKYGKMTDGIIQKRSKEEERHQTKAMSVKETKHILTFIYNDENNKQHEDKSKVTEEFYATHYEADKVDIIYDPKHFNAEIVGFTDKSSWLWSICVFIFVFGEIILMIYLIAEETYSGEIVSASIGAIIWGLLVSIPCCAFSFWRYLHKEDDEDANHDNTDNANSANLNEIEIEQNE